MSKRERLDEDDLPPSKRVLIERNIEEEYFSMYGTIHVHREMLEDQVRNECYSSAIQAANMQDATVLDLGVGTGILSMFSARRGAKRVFGIEANKTIAEQAIRIIQQNNFQDKITVIQDKVENVHLEEKVDFIVSEWMGYMLLYEAMIHSLIHARDKFLKPGGKMLPSSCEMFLMPFTYEEPDPMDLSFWDNVHGFDYSPIKNFAKTCLTIEPTVDGLDPQNQMALRACTIKKIDCLTVTSDQIFVDSPFEFKSIVSSPLYGFAIWFNTYFDVASPPIILTTSPECESTHWSQTLFQLTEPIPVNQDDVISGRISIKSIADNPRSLEINIHLTLPVPLNKKFVFH